MTSRKRRAAKEKRARKAAAAAAANETGAAAGARAPRPKPRCALERMTEACGLCAHGLDRAAVVDAAEVKRFFEMIVRYQYQSGDHPLAAPSVAELLLDSFDEHMSVWNDDANRELAIRALLSHGTHVIVWARRGREDYQADIQVARMTAVAVLLLEDHDGRGSRPSSFGLANAMKSKEFCTLRNIARFFRRRIECNCLDEVYRRMKERQPARLLECDNCDKLVDRSALLACGNCKGVSYCSRSCQKEDWDKRHRNQCVFYSFDRMRRKTEKVKEKIANKQEVDADFVTDTMDGIPESMQNMTMDELVSESGGGST